MHVFKHHAVDCAVGLSVRVYVHVRVRRCCVWSHARAYTFVDVCSHVYACACAFT